MIKKRCRLIFFSWFRSFNVWLPSSRNFLWFIIWLSSNFSSSGLSNTLCCYSIHINLLNCCDFETKSSESCPILLKITVRDCKSWRVWIRPKGFPLSSHYISFLFPNPPHHITILFLNPPPLSSRKQLLQLASYLSASTTLVPLYLHSCLYVHFSTDLLVSNQPTYNIHV